MRKSFFLALVAFIFATCYSEAWDLKSVAKKAIATVQEAGSTTNNQTRNSRSATNNQTTNSQSTRKDPMSEMYERMWAEQEAKRQAEILRQQIEDSIKQLNKEKTIKWLNENGFTKAYIDSMQNVFAKKAELRRQNDHFKFDDEGKLIEFQKTTSDNYIFSYKDKLLTVEMPNGDKVYAPNASAQNWYEFAGTDNIDFSPLVARLIPNGYGQPMRERYFTIKTASNDEITIANFQYTPGTYYTINGNNCIIEYKMGTDSFESLYHPNWPSEANRFIKLFADEITSKIVRYKDGEIGYVYKKFDEYPGHDRYARFFNGDEFRDLKYATTTYENGFIELDTLLSYSTLASVYGLYNNATLVKKDGTIEVYNGKGIKDDFKSQQETAKNQAQIKAKAEELAKEKAYHAGLLQKYGKANIDKLLLSNIVVGMPFALLQSIYEKKYESGNDWANIIKLSLSIDHGTSKCYDYEIWSHKGDNFLVIHRGYLWTNNGKVSSVVVY